MGKMTCWLSRMRTIAFCCTTVIWGTATQSEAITLEVPNFNAPGLWTPNIQGSGPELINQRPFGFHALLPADSTQSGAVSFLAEYRSSFLIHGDFDVQVDYSVLSSSTGSGARLGISMADWYGENWVSHSAGNEVYHFGAGGFTQHVRTTDTSGKLRLTREGSIFSGYYWDHGAEDWVLLGSRVAPTYDFQLRIGAWGHDSSWRDQEVLVGFDNTRITAEAFIHGRPSRIPESSSTGTLFVFAAASLLVLSSKRPIRKILDAK